MSNHWLDRAKQRLEKDATQAPGVVFDRLKAIGIINERGEVTGHVHRWDAYLAITGVQRPPGAPQIETFHCLKPVFGIPGGSPVDVSREAMVAYLQQGKKIITARHDDRLELWMEGDDVHLSPSGFVRLNGSDDPKDNVGDLPEFQQTTSRL